jgi:5'-3' exonuclease
VGLAGTLGRPPSVDTRTVATLASGVPVTVHLIDASPYLFRAFFALPDSIRAPDGGPVNAVFGFVGFLNRYLAEERPTHLAALFDRSLTTSFRNELHAGYKAGRELPPPELERQQQSCRDVARAIGIACFDDARYEADDLIATLHARLRADGHRVVVVTSDKDLGALVDDGTVLFDFAKGLRYGPAEIAEKFGVRPDQIADYLGLAGDPVDDIPGVRGVGKKSAAALLDAFGTLDALYARLEERGKEALDALGLRGARGLARKLLAGRDDALLSRELATLARDAPVAATLADLERHPPARAEAEPVFAELGLAGSLARVPDLR